jgi:hypothetical protein
MKEINRKVYIAVDGAEFPSKEHPADWELEY